MLDIKQFREEIIKPALELIGLWSNSAEELLVLTCAHESLGGTYIVQENGPAIGIYQMEPSTYNDLWNSFLTKKSREAYKILNSIHIASVPPVTIMKYNSFYATLMARIFYLRFKEPLPPHDDIDGLYDYYKKYWNTRLGSATKEQVAKDYYRFTKRRAPKNV